MLYYIGFRVQGLLCYSILGSGFRVYYAILYKV